MRISSSSDTPFTEPIIENLLKTYSLPNADYPKHLMLLQITRSNLRPDEASESVQCKTALNKAITQILEQPKSLETGQAELLYFRYIENGGTTDVAAGEKFGYNKAKGRREIQKARHALTAVLNALEAEAQRTHKNQLVHKLGPATYRELMGSSDLWQRVSTNIVEHNDKWISVVTGIGGIGKSSQTHKAILDAIEQGAVQNLVFIDAKNKALNIADFLEQAAEQLDIPREQVKNKTTAELSLYIAQIFKTTPYLILVDGIEEHVSHLIHELIAFANPSQIIVTSRVEPDDKSHIHYYEVPQLSEAAAVKLIIEAKNAIQFPEPKPLPKDKLQKIIEKIGGNPLALKIIGGLLTDYHVDEIIDDLVKVQHPDTEKLYRRVYIKAWNNMHSTSQQVFASMAVLPGIRSFSKGLLFSFTQHLLKSERELADILYDLKSRSLIDIDRSETHAAERTTTHYKIHNLTRSFLETDIVDWGA
ncbi:MAG: NB-ARC domain-containing protein [Anaerolineae bacterium]